MLGSIEGEELEGVLNIIRDSTNLPAGGEIELDFDMLSHVRPSACRLHVFLFAVFTALSKGARARTRAS